ncbi:hypothetical protein PTKIN_Ptkin16aG0485300 [Pterospermum kingtungense]
MSDSLQDHMGRELIRFSKSIGVSDSNSAELWAVKEAMSLFASSRWCGTKELIIESDSNWLKNSGNVNSIAINLLLLISPSSLAAVAVESKLPLDCVELRFELGFDRINKRVRQTKDKETEDAVERNQAGSKIGDEKMSDGMKEIRQLQIVEATLVATVTFAAVFTMPGDY